MDQRKQPPSPSRNVAIANDTTYANPNANANGNENHNANDNANSDATIRSQRSIVRAKNRKKLHHHSNQRILSTACLSLFLISTILLSISVLDLNHGHENQTTRQRHLRLDIHNKDKLVVDADWNASILQDNNNHNKEEVIITTPTNPKYPQRILETTPEGDKCSPSSESSGGWVNAMPPFLQYILISVLILFSAFFSGLTLSMMGLDTTGLEIVMSGDDIALRRAAGKIYPVRKNGNLLLCTLLLGNVAVNTLLGILMAEITGGTVGFLTSTALIVIFGEILPQALFSRYALQVGEKAVPFVKFIICLLYIIAKPLAFCLDKLLGHELGTTYSKAEMSKLLEIHVKEGRFNQEVGTAMKGALQYQDMIVKEVMTPLDKTFMINVDDRLNFEAMTTIFKTGYSRIPVYETTVGNVIGLLFVKDLIFIDPEDATPVKNLMSIFGRKTHFVWPDDKLGDVLRHLKSGHTHMALVRGINHDEDEKMDPYYALEGIITLEDIIEIILGEEIVDETDAWVDVEHTTEVRRETEFDWARLRLLDAKIVDETLSDDEVRAVSAHLRQNYSGTVKELSDNQLMRMIGATAVTELEEVQKEPGENLPVRSKLLYEKGVKSNLCTLVLQGKITVLAGKDNFRSDISSWSILATNALTDDGFTPDFSAYVSSGPCRCLQFNRDIFRAACDASILTKLPERGFDKDDQEDDIEGENSLEKEGSPRFGNQIQELNKPYEDQSQTILAPQTNDQKSATSSLGGKNEDIVERSEHRGRMLAALLKESNNESKRGI